MVAVPFGPNPPVRVGEMIAREIGALTEGAVGEDAVRRNRRHVVDELRTIDESPERLARALSCIDKVPCLSPAMVEAVSKISRQRLLEIVRPWLESRHAIDLDLSPAPQPVRIEEEPQQKRRSR